MFIYFDLGNVLLYFDHAAACRQMAAVASEPRREVTEDDVRRVLFTEGLEWEYECGTITTDELYDRFCLALGVRPDRQGLMHAASDIFWPNLSIKPVVGALRHARHRLGILSNTNDAHWQFITRAGYGLVPDAFDVGALSYELGTMKPDSAIYARAAELAGVPASEIFFIDDRPDNVAAAREAGFDAVVYTDTETLVADLRGRGVAMNY